MRQPKPQARPSQDDADFIEARYLYPGHQDHGVMGVFAFDQRPRDLPCHRKGKGWVIDYGRHRSGDRFLVHKKDVELSQWFEAVVDSVAGVTPLQERRADVPARPQPIAPPIPTPRPKAPPETAGPPLQDEVAALRRQIEELAKPITLSKEDLQLIPGVSADLAARLEASGEVKTSDDVLRLGVEGLQGFKGIGPSKARTIYDAVIALMDRKPTGGKLEDEIAAFGR